MFKRIDHINFSVRDLEESMDWYHRVFDFEIRESGERQGSRWAIMESQGSFIALYERTDCEMLTSDEQRERRLHGMGHAGFEINDEQAWLERMAKEQVFLDHDWVYPNSKSWYIRDPTGYEIEVVKWNEQVDWSLVSQALV